MIDFLQKHVHWLFAGIGVVLLQLFIKLLIGVYRRIRKAVVERPSPAPKPIVESAPTPGPPPSDIESKSLFTHKGKETISKVLRYNWPLLLCALALDNYIWESFGSTLKDVFLLLTVLYTMSHYLLLYLESKRKKLALYGRLRRFVSLVAVIIAIPLLNKAVITGYNSSNEEANFKYRLDNILEHRYRIYNSPFMPEWAYKLLKKMLRRPYYPQLYDQIKRYDSIKVYTYHLDTTGIIGYEYQGKSYPGSVDSTSIFNCINYGEAKSANLNKQLICRSLPGNQEIKPNKREFLPNFRGVSIFSSYTIPADFYFIHWFCTPGSMSAGSSECKEYDKYDGFVIDLRWMAHPPLTIDVSFVTDMQVVHVDIYTLERRQSLVDWLLARPFYPQDDEALLMPMSQISDQRQVDSVKTNLICHRTSWDPKKKKIVLYRSAISQHLADFRQGANIAVAL